MMANGDATFIFRKTKYFWQYVNRQFKLMDMNDIFDKGGFNEGDYTFVLAEQVPSNIYDCIDEYGCLIEDANELDIIDLADVYSNISGSEMPYFKLYCDPIQDFEGGFTISMDKGSTDVQIQLGDSQTIYLQGIFLCKREASETHAENFVMAYATISSPINVRNFITVPFQGLVAGVGYCATQ